MSENLVIKVQIPPLEGVKIAQTFLAQISNWQFLLKRP